MKWFSPSGSANQPRSLARTTSRMRFNNSILTFADFFCLFLKIFQHFNVAFSWKSYLFLHNSTIQSCPFLKIFQQFNHLPTLCWTENIVFSWTHLSSGGDPECRLWKGCLIEYFHHHANHYWPTPDNTSNVIFWWLKCCHCDDCDVIKHTCSTLSLSVNPGSVYRWLWCN